MLTHISQDCCCQCPHPFSGGLWPTHASAGDPQTLTGRSGSVSSGVTVPFPWVLVYTRFCCALQEWSLCYPQCCGSPVIKSFWPSKSDSLGIPVPFWIPRLGSLMWGLEPSQWCDNFFGITVFHLWVAHLMGIGFDFILVAPLLLPPYFSFVLGCVVSFFGGFQHPPVNGCSTASCDCGAFAGENECMSFYSTILNQS